MKGNFPVDYFNKNANVGDWLQEPRDFLRQIASIASQGASASDPAIVHIALELLALNADRPLQLLGRGNS